MNKGNFFGIFDKDFVPNCKKKSNSYQNPKQEFQKFKNKNCYKNMSKLNYSWLFYQKLLTHMPKD